MIKNNIALKEGDYPGKKKITRMRNCIMNQVNFLQEDRSNTNQNDPAPQSNEQAEFF